MALVWNRCREGAAYYADAGAARTSGQAATRPGRPSGVVERRTSSGNARGATPASSRIGLSTIAGIRAVHPFDEDAEIRKRGDCHVDRFQVSVARQPRKRIAVERAQEIGRAHV